MKNKTQTARIKTSARGDMSVLLHEDIVDGIHKTLKKGRGVRIKNIGKLRVSTAVERRRLDINTGEIVDTGKKYKKVAFITSETLKTKINSNVSK